MSIARARAYTWDDFVALPEDDRRELIDGELVEIEMPRRIHEHIVATLIFFLVGFARSHGGRVLASGYKVRVNDRRGVMPDVQFYRDGNEPDVDQEDGLVHGQPDLVVEIISPSSRRYDRVIKLAYYASLRVPEYWIVDPESTTLERLVFTKKGYANEASAEGDGTFEPPSFPGLRIPLAELWATRPPKPKKRARKRR